MIERANPDRQLIGQLADQIDQTLRRYLAPGTRVALLDYPNHRNVGDNAIWLGERASLERCAVDVAYAADLVSFSPAVLRARLGADGVILFHGGGSLGDVWPEHEDFRERVIVEFTSHRIIQLPQTIHFANRVLRERARSVFASHGSLVVLCRDRASLRVAHEDLGVRAELCTDMAFALGTLDSSEPARHDVVWLCRTDHEAVPWSGVTPDALDVLRCDWVNDVDRGVAAAIRSRFASHLRRLLGRLARRLPAAAWTLVNPLWLWYFDRQCRHQLERGCRMLARGTVVMTDRLHGHILALLLGIPHVVLDNNYGKLGSFVSTFTAEARSMIPADTPTEAVGVALKLLADERRSER